MKTIIPLCFIGIILILTAIFIPTEYTNLKCIDGDTFSIGSTYYRIKNIDTPEKKEANYKKASTFTCKYLFKNINNINLAFTKRDKYDRILIPIPKLEELLIAKCLAEPFWTNTTNNIKNLYMKNCKN